MMDDVDYQAAKILFFASEISEFLLLLKLNKDLPVVEITISYKFNLPIQSSCLI